MWFAAYANCGSSESRARTVVGSTKVICRPYQNDMRARFYPFRCCHQARDLSWPRPRLASAAWHYPELTYHNYSFAPSNRSKTSKRAKRGGFLSSCQEPWQESKALLVWKQMLNFIPSLQRTCYRIAVANAILAL